MKYMKKSWEERFLSSVICFNDPENGDGDQGGGNDVVDNSNDNPDDSQSNDDQQNDADTNAGSAILDADDIRETLARGSKRDREEKAAAAAQKRKEAAEAKKKAPVDPKVQGKPPAKKKEADPPPNVDDKLDRVLGALEKAVLSPRDPQPQKDTQDNKGNQPKKVYFSPEGPGGGQLEVPKAYMEAIDSEDPEVRHRGVTALMNAQANLIMDHFGRQLSDYHNFITSQIIPQMAAQTRARAKANEVFYESNPDLDNEDLYPLIDKAGAKVAEEWTKAGKKILGRNGVPTVDFMSAVAERVRTLTNTTPTNGGQASQNVLDQSGNGPPPKRATFLRPGARPPAASRQDDKSADILATITSR